MVADYPYLSMIVDFQMMFYNGGFFVFGGFFVPGYKMQNTIARFDESTKTWSQVGSLVHLRDRFCMVQDFDYTNNYVTFMIFGGYCQGCNNGQES